MVPPLAVAMGATTIEKHYTISRNLEGPDHKFAIEPTELHDMVQNIRIAEKCIGIKTGLLTESEKNFRNATRSVVSKRNIGKGELLTEQNITAMRPSLEGSIPAIQYYDTLCKASTRTIEKGTVLHPGDVS